MCACFEESEDRLDGPATGASESSAHSKDEIAKRREAMSRQSEVSRVGNIDGILFTNTVYAAVSDKMMRVVVRVNRARREGAASL